MNEPLECIEITRRFFDALEMIKSYKIIRGLLSFTKKYNENYWNFYTIKKEGTRIKQEWLTYLVRDFNVSPLWLLTGKGPVFTKEIVPRKKYMRASPKKKTVNDTDKT